MKKNILVIDDNRSIRDVLPGSLCQFLKDCKVTTAVDGAKGLSVLQSVPVDLILTDLDIPADRGYAFIEQAIRDYPAIPLCVMTGDCSPQVRNRLSALGVKRYIEKPFQVDVLAAMLREELDRQRRADQGKGAGRA